MLQSRTSRRCRRRRNPSRRRGNIIVLSAVAMTMILGFTALTVDVGFLMETRTQMQAAADGAALAAALEMPNGWGTGKTLTADSVSTNAKTAAQTVAATYRVGEQPSAYVDQTRDIRLGQRTADAQGQWVETWNVSPYNMVEVTVRRDQALTKTATGTTVTRADQAIPTFFAGAIGSTQTTVVTKATAVLAPGNGFYIAPGSGLSCPLL